jgi:hypothetical protein
VEGWPSEMMTRFSELATAAARSSPSDLCEAILEIENTDARHLPEGILTALSRGIWDQPSAPDVIKVSDALKRGVPLRDALFEGIWHR